MRLALLLLAACETVASTPIEEPSPPPGPTQIVEPAPPPTPAPVPAKSSPRKATTRDELDSWIPKLPDRALYVTWMGLGGQSHALLDVDTRKLTTHYELATEKRSDRVKTLPADEVQKLWTLAEVAWRADPPKHGDVTDFRHVLVAVDHDEVLYVSVGGPIEAGEPAGELSQALGKLAGLIR